MPSIRIETGSETVFQGRPGDGRAKDWKSIGTKLDWLVLEGRWPLSFPRLRHQFCSGVARGHLWRARQRPLQGALQGPFQGADAFKLTEGKKRTAKKNSKKKQHLCQPEFKFKNEFSKRKQEQVRESKTRQERAREGKSKQEQS